MNIRKSLNIIGFIACLIVGIFTSIELSGTEVGLVVLLSIFFY